MNTSPVSLEKDIHTPRRRSSKKSFSFNMKLLPFLIGTVTAVIAIIALLIHLFGSNKYDPPVKTYWESYYFNEASSMDSLAPIWAWQWIAADTGVDQDGVYTYLSEYGAEYRQKWCERFGNDLNLSFEIIKEVQ